MVLGAIIANDTESLENRVEAIGKMVEHVSSGFAISSETYHETEQAFCKNPVLDPKLIHLYTVVSVTDQIGPSILSCLEEAIPATDHLEEILSLLL